jgi:hypothetical protein
MTIQISPDQAMDAIAASRPDPETIDAAWTAERADQTLNQVLSAADSAPKSKVRHGRRWALIGVAAALALTVGLAAQSIIPVGTPGAPAKANALDRLADVITGSPIPANGYAKEVVEVRSLDDSTGKPVKDFTTRWVANDGWVWSARTSTTWPGTWYAKSPDLASSSDSGRALLPDPLPTDPASLKQQIADRYDKAMKLRKIFTPEQIRAQFAPMMGSAIYEALADPRTSTADRITLVRTLSLVDGIAITENGLDPDNRPALVATITFRFNDTDRTVSVFLDPANGEVLGCEQRTSDRALWAVELITERSIVTDLPERIVKVLGTKRVKKDVGQPG